MKLNWQLKWPNHINKQPFNKIDTSVNNANKCLVKIHQLPHSSLSFAHHNQFICHLSRCIEHLCTFLCTSSQVISDYQCDSNTPACHQTSPGQVINHVLLIHLNPRGSLLNESNRLGANDSISCRSQLKHLIARASIVYCRFVKSPLETRATIMFPKIRTLSLQRLAWRSVIFPKFNLLLY